MFKQLFDKFFGLFGYYRKEVVCKSYNDIYETCLEQEGEIHGLITSIALIQRELYSHNILLTSLMTLNGNEIVLLEKDFIKDILNKGLETVYVNTDNGGVELTLQLKPDENNAD